MYITLTIRYTILYSKSSGPDVFRFLELFRFWNCGVIITASKTFFSFHIFHSYLFIIAIIIFINILLNECEIIKLINNKAVGQLRPYVP